MFAVKSALRVDLNGWRNDLRSISSEFTLDKAGFELVHHQTKVKDFADEEHVKQVYYPEIDELVKRVTGGDHVHILSHMCRRATTKEALGDAANKADSEFVTIVNPARFVHVDQSYRGSEQILYLNLPEEEADRVLKKRWAIINVWQPFDKKVTREPLAFCDYRSLDEKDLRTVVANLPPPGSGDYSNVSKNMSHKQRYEYNLNGEEAPRYEVANLAYNPEQKWYYLSEQEPEEAWVFKIFDSKKDGRARCAVHSSFPFVNQPDEGEARTSVEIRCFVFWDDEEVE